MKSLYGLILKQDRQWFDGEVFKYWFRILLLIIRTSTFLMGYKILGHLVFRTLVEIFWLFYQNHHAGKIVPSTFVIRLSRNFLIICQESILVNGNRQLLVRINKFKSFLRQTLEVLILNTTSHSTLKKFRYSSFKFKPISIISIKILTLFFFTTFTVFSFLLFFPFLLFPPTVYYFYFFATF